MKWNGQDMEREGAGLVEGTDLAFVWRKWGKPWETSVRLGCLRSVIRILQLPNTKLQLSIRSWRIATRNSTWLVSSYQSTRRYIAEDSNVSFLCPKNLQHRCLTCLSSHIKKVLWCSCLPEVRCTDGGFVVTPERVVEKRWELRITLATDRPTSHVPEHCHSHGIFIVYEANNWREFGVRFSSAIGLVLFRSRVSNYWPRVSKKAPHIFTYTWRSSCLETMDTFFEFCLPFHTRNVDFHIDSILQCLLGVASSGFVQSTSSWFTLFTSKDMLLPVAVAFT